LTRLFYCDVCGDFEGTRREVEEHVDEKHEDLYYGHDLTSIGKRSRRNKLAKLREYDLLGCKGPAQNRVYFVLDESIEPPVDVRRLESNSMSVRED
jgi:hypothetical protein